MDMGKLNSNRKADLTACRERYDKGLPSYTCGSLQRVQGWRDSPVFAQNSHLYLPTSNQRWQRMELWPLTEGCHLPLLAHWCQLLVSDGILALNPQEWLGCPIELGGGSGVGVVVLLNFLNWTQDTKLHPLDNILKIGFMGNWAVSLPSWGSWFPSPVNFSCFSSSACSFQLTCENNKRWHLLSGLLRLEHFCQGFRIARVGPTPWKEATANAR